MHVLHSYQGIILATHYTHQLFQLLKAFGTQTNALNFSSLTNED